MIVEYYILKYTSREPYIDTLALWWNCRSDDEHRNNAKKKKINILIYVVNKITSINRSKNGKITEGGLFGNRKNIWRVMCTVDFDRGPRVTFANRLSFISVSTIIFTRSAFWAGAVYELVMWWWPNLCSKSLTSNFVMV